MERSLSFRLLFHLSTFLSPTLHIVRQSVVLVSFQQWRFFHLICLKRNLDEGFQISEKLNIVFAFLIRFCFKKLFMRF